MSLTAYQLEQRAGRIGSSSIAAVLGLSPWSTPFEAWLEITGRQPFEPNDACRLGDAMEPVIAPLAAAKLGLGTPRKVEDSRLVDDWAVVTPDFEITLDTGERLFLEIKNVGGSVWLSGHWNEHSATGYPEYVYAQTQFQMHAHGVRHGAIGAVVASQGPWVYRFRYDEEFALGMCALGRRWWQRYVAGDEQPPIDYTDSAREYLIRKYPRIMRHRLVKASTEQDALACELRETVLAIKHLEQEKAETRNQLAEQIGDAHGLMTSVGAIKWGERSDGKGGKTRQLTTPRWKAV